ncbi:MAG TPA: hypothetical protein VFS38_02520 [Actinomycetota bacterium]|nr:hypothetical protein [Actinomycetota bacterium]
MGATNSVTDILGPVPGTVAGIIDEGSTDTEPISTDPIDKSPRGGGSMIAVEGAGGHLAELPIAAAYRVLGPATRAALTTSKAFL